MPDINGGPIEPRQSSALRAHDLWWLQHQAQRIHGGWQPLPLSTSYYREDSYGPQLGPDSTDELGNSPLHLACHPAKKAKISVDFLRGVLALAPAIDRKNHAGWTPLALAVLLMPAQVVRLLVESGVCESPLSMQDAMLLAANYERAEITTVLLESGRVCLDEGYRNDSLSFARRFDQHATYLLKLDGLAGHHPLLDREVARQERTDAQVLQLLAGSRDRPTLRAVTLNPNTPTETLFELAPRFSRPFFCNPAFNWLLLEDPEKIFELGGGVIRNILRLRKCPESVIQWAATHGNESEKLAVLRRRDVSVETLRAIAGNSEGWLRALAIANDPDASTELLGSAIRVCSEADRRLATHRNCTSELLDRLSESSDEDVSRLVLANPQSSEVARVRITNRGIGARRSVKLM